MKDLENLISFLSDKNAECLDIRRKFTHDQVRTTMFYDFVHRRNNKFYWGPSLEYGFNCFNELQENNLCDDFEYQIWKNCNFTEHIPRIGVP